MAVVVVGVDHYGTDIAVRRRGWRAVSSSATSNDGAAGGRCRVGACIRDHPTSRAPAHNLAISKHILVPFGCAAEEIKEIMQMNLHGAGAQC